ncbi:hypothetical protein BHE90_007728 [Fusarium euwallaceae]|uniref:NACHT-NTPase and P-loop NTPases N-terminal domain-containing protein n=1 Tax=Fusarium euwallaceae TaxID=1147111 RepID=A0A430LQ54_9HYPO|nr:hypothetical protein BHE90_007728 [Fusarium euwallaceae]
MESVEKLFELLSSDPITTQIKAVTRVLIRGIIEDADRTKKEAEQVKAEYQRRLDRLDPDFGTFQNAMQGTMEEAVTRIHGAICTSVADALQDQLMAEPEQVGDTNAEAQNQIQESQAIGRQSREHIEKIEREVDRLGGEVQVSQRERDKALLQVKSL